MRCSPEAGDYVTRCPAVLCPPVAAWAERQAVFRWAPVRKTAERKRCEAECLPFRIRGFWPTLREKWHTWSGGGGGEIPPQNAAFSPPSPATPAESRSG